VCGGGRGGKKRKAATPSPSTDTDTHTHSEPLELGALLPLSSFEQQARAARAVLAALGGDESAGAGARALLAQGGRDLFFKWLDQIYSTGYADGPQLNDPCEKGDSKREGLLRLVEDLLRLLDQVYLFVHIRC
jgi:hypothetical protein